MESLTSFVASEILGGSEEVEVWSVVIEGSTVSRVKSGINNR